MQISDPKIRDIFNSVQEGKTKQFVLIRRILYKKISDEHEENDDAAENVSIDNPFEDESSRKRQLFQVLTIYICFGNILIGTNKYVFRVKSKLRGVPNAPASLQV